MMNTRQDSLAVHSASSFDTDIVVDLGCCGYERNGRMEDSIHTLVKRFKPKILFGFDPHPALREAVGDLHGTTIITSRQAAWIGEGRIGLELQGNCTHVHHIEWARTGWESASCFDLATWVRSLPDVKIVLKVDVEGAEYILLPHLIEHGAIDRFRRILVEWHTGKYANGFESDRASILERIPCPVEEWQ
jgi:hypothetical protein